MPSAAFSYPLADWRATSTPTAGAQASASYSGTSFPQQVMVTGSQAAPRPIVTGVSARISCGTGVQVPIVINLIDGASGGTNVMRAWSLSAGANTSAGFDETNLNFICQSGTCTIEFAGTGIPASQQTVNAHGFLQGPYT